MQLLYYKCGTELILEFAKLFIFRLITNNYLYFNVFLRLTFPYYLHPLLSDDKKITW